MSSIQVYHENILKSIKNNKRNTHEELVIYGDKGLRVKYFHVEGDNVEKITVTSKDGKYYLKTTTNKETNVEELDSKGLMSALKQPKLKFSLEYLKDVLKSLKGGKR